jgi:uncharacterized protein
MDILDTSVILIGLAAFFVAMLTFFSGFGLGTLLMPVMALFVPLPLAIALTAVVHLANNLFKLALVGRRADPRILLRFGLPAVLFAFVGAWLLGWLSGLEPIWRYMAFGHERAVQPVSLTIGVLILVLVGLELSPRFANMAFDRRCLPYGGALTGFLGGLSGHQGAFRSLFLIKLGLDKSAFVATGVVLAVMVDVARLSVYGGQILQGWETIPTVLLVVACASAFIGSYLGSRLLHKITLKTVQRSVSGLLIVIGLGLVSGLIS